MDKCNTKILMVSSVAKIMRKVVKTKCTSNVKSFKEIPGPLSLPFVGTMFHYVPPFGQYSFEKLHRTYAKMHEQYGDIVKEVLSKNRIIVHVFHPQDMMTVYTQSGSCPRRMSHRALARYRQERPHLYSGPGLFPSNDEEWYRFRNLFKKVFVQPTTTAGCSNALEDVADELVETIEPRLDSNSEVDLLPLLFSWGLESIGYITLNKRLGCLSIKGSAEAVAMVKAAEDTHMAVYLTENIPYNYEKNYKKLEAAQDVLSQLVQKYMEQALERRKHKQDEECILYKLIDSEGATKKDVFTMVLDMFLAGIDTTAFALSFALYHLARSKRIQDKLREELMECLPTRDSRISHTDHRMQYLKAVVHETLRVNPVAIGTGRILSKDLVLGGYLVPSGTMVILQHQVASMKEKFFSDSQVFEPERWISKRVPFNVSCPFGFGTRACIGSKIALRELHISIAKLIRNYEISYHHEEINSYSRLINVPDKPLRLRLKRLSS